jgi:release factor glutamine methyltransferase
MRMTINLAEWQALARQSLSSLSENPALEAQVLLAHVTGQSRAWVLSHPEIILTPDQQAVLDSLLGRLTEGVPLPYLTGEQEFYALPFRVTPDVLIPRPETELLVERAAAWLEVNPGRRRCADIGSGSGCIAVSLHTTLRIRAVPAAPDRPCSSPERMRRNGVSNRSTSYRQTSWTASAGRSI